MAVAAGGALPVIENHPPRTRLRRVLASDS